MKDKKKKNEKFFELPLGKVIDYKLSEFEWEITIKPNKGKEKFIKEIARSPFLAGIKIIII